MVLALIELRLFLNILDFYTLAEDAIAGFSNACLAVVLQIPLAPQPILCGPQDANIKIVNSKGSIFIIYRITLDCMSFNCSKYSLWFDSLGILC
jgi:hypothetical protein